MGDDPEIRILLRKLEADLWRYAAESTKESQEHRMARELRELNYNESKSIAEKDFTDGLLTTDEPGPGETRLWQKHKDTLAAREAMEAAEEQARRDHEANH